MSDAFDDAVALHAQADGTWQGHTSPAYGNMVGPFGGITAAQALTAVLRHPERLGDPVSYTVNFAAALADGPFTVTAVPVRTNRSTQHWTIDVRQAGAVCVTATALTAVRRATWSTDELAMPAVPAADTFERNLMTGGVEWIHRYDMRMVEGGFPKAFDGSEKPSLTRLWVRDEPARPLDFASLAALSDVFFPRVWLRRAKPTPVGTVSMTVYFHAGAAELEATGTGHLFAQAQAQTFRNGFSDQTGQLWNAAGQLLVTTHQIVYYKE